MKKLYYFSKTKLQFIEIRNYKAKLVSYFTLAVLTFSAFIFGSFFFINSIANPSNSLIALRSENEMLRKKVLTISNNYELLNRQVDSLSRYDHEFQMKKRNLVLEAVLSIIRWIS